MWRQSSATWCLPSHYPSTPKTCRGESAHLRPWITLVYLPGITLNTSLILLAHRQRSRPEKNELGLPFRDVLDEPPAGRLNC